MHRLNGCGFFSERVRDRRHRHARFQCILELPRFSAYSERAYLDSRRAVRSGLGGIDERESDARHHLLEKLLVLLPGHVGIELNALDAGLGETRTPFPVSELAEGGVLIN